jgi:hypothetical protein
MADRAKRLTELPAVTSITNNDIVVVVANIAGTASTRKITVSNFFASVPPVIPVFVGNSSSSGTPGEIRYDGNYIYVCVANNTWKRADLNTWS